MTASELAQKLEGSEYPFKLPDVFQSEAKENDLVIVYGASDDLMEFEGAIYDEIGVYDGGFAQLNHHGIIKNKCDDDDCPNFNINHHSPKTIEALWCAENGYSWTYKTDIPHAAFNIVEDGEMYCRGIVFNLKNLTADL